ncbi:MAG: phosphoesterase, partial [Kiritimatiellia bacterium]
AMVARGYVRTRQEAFDQHLGKKGRAYHDRQRLTPADGINMIRRAHGIAVLAHPFTLSLKRPEMARVVSELKDQGLQGIEIYYPQQKSRQCKHYLALARQLDLLVTGGTDFHGAPMPEVKLGRGFGDLEIPDELLEKLDACPR